MIDVAVSISWPVIISALLGLFLAGYLYLTRNYGKYEAMGLHSVKPSMIFGNAKDIILQRKSTYDHAMEFYQEFGDNKVGIYYDGNEPVLYVKDLELIKQIMVTDFNHFMDFGFFKNEITYMKVNDLGLLSKTGEEWKSLKHTVMPALNLKNLKSATHVMNEIAKTLVVKLKSTNGKEVMAMDAIGGYVMDCITRIAFSMNIDAVNNPDNEMSKHSTHLMSLWRFALASFAPKIMKLFNIAFFEPKAIEYFRKVSENVIKDRGQKGLKLDDTLGVMMRIRDKTDQDLTDESTTGFTIKNTKKMDLSDDVIARTMMQFFLDGNETVCGYLSMCLYFLATSPDAQDKAMAEVDDFADKHDEVTGDNVNELKYLDQLFSETGRLTGLSETKRTCTKPWTIPGTKVTIPVGMRVFIPIYPIQLDEKYFPDPMNFNPDRFSPENKNTIPYASFMPFGLGPRMCIGVQIARMEGKVLLYHILKNFRLEIGKETPVPIKWAKDGFFRLEGENWVKFIPRS